MLFSKIINFFKIFILAIFIARFFAFFAEKMNINDEIIAINNGTITTLSPSLLAFAVVITFPLIIIVFWSFLIGAQKIHLNLKSGLIEITRWRAALAVSVFELAIMGVTL